MRECLVRYAYPSSEDAYQLVIEIESGRLMNPSIPPNTDYTEIVSDYANRDIATGEEIVCDYDEFDPAQELLPALVATHSVEPKRRPNGHARKSNY